MKKKKNKILRVIPQVIANAVIVLSCVYILFYILDIFNPMLHFLGSQVWITRYLDIILACLSLVLGILFIVCTWQLYTKRTKKKMHSSVEHEKDPDPLVMKKRKAKKRPAEEAEFE